ncbi:hypothetical protein ET475_09400 [Microbacterium protaetiae]|uniref:Peptidoglycan-binding protein n=1 Tax=Microbacterium protaetiae TaxID=2509458 RepID=A0A4P6ED60_9MICO|nr:hypothetical protein [Microbacterium protaetiae]QAY60182.1 hypothetical protein ET475_09400 [Microbacterium protaetiae]
MTAESRTAPRRRVARWVVTALAALLAVALIGGGWFAATLFTSPAQRAAAASAPSAVPVVVSVEQGDLIDTRTLSGSIRPIASFEAALTAPADAHRAVVTTVEAVSGTKVVVGNVVATVNGSPVFALESPFPFYRDMGVGDSGIDVSALQRSLVSLGLLSQADGQFGQATASAVAQLFTRAGFTAPMREASVGEAASDGATSDDASSTDDDSTKTAAKKPAKTVYLPVSSTLTAPSLPAAVSSAPAVGTDVGAGAEFELTAKTFAIFVTLPDSLPDGLPAGTKVTVSGAGLDDAPATVFGAASSAVGDAGKGDAGSAGGVDAGSADADTGAADASAGSDGAAAAEVRIDLNGALHLTQKQSGQSVTVTATVRKIASDALIVPVTAVADADAAHGYVIIADGAAAGTRVAVSIIGEIDGRVALAPGEGLKAGDRVRVG